MNRRRYLTAAGTALTTPLVGCIGSRNDPGNSTTTTKPTDTTNPGTDTSTEPGETDDDSIHGRLHNDVDEAKTFTVTITDADGTVLTEGEQTVGPTASYPIPAVGQPGATRTFKVTVGDTTVSETLTFDVERTPQKVDGYVDVTFTSRGEILIEFTPLDYPHDTVVTPDQRFDTPPYEIERPEQPDSPSEDDDWNEAYLGEHMPTSPSIEFTPVTDHGSVLPRRQYDFTGSIYWAELIATEHIRDALLDLDAVDQPTRTSLLDVDFDESVIVAVETGYGSGSVEHRWARVESTENAVHLHGYYTDPYIQTDDLTTRVSLIEVARPADELGFAKVSLTVSESRRVHFNSTEGMVKIDSS